jgi:adenylosuccinate lyase
MLDAYTSPFSTRYASPEMSYLFSTSYKISTFRRLWTALAEAQKTLGLPITDRQIKQMENHIDTLDMQKIHLYEKQFRHDVAAHIHAFADDCPEARPIIHLGATSSYVTDNTDLIQMREALRLLHGKIVHVLQKLAKLAQTHAHDPTLSYTHYQPAQPTTIGKRICLWLQDFYHDALDWERLADAIPFLGAKGATGTQASFLALFEGDEEKTIRTAHQQKVFFQLCPSHCKSNVLSKNRSLSSQCIRIFCRKRPQNGDRSSPVSARTRVQRVL